MFVHERKELDDIRLAVEELLGKINELKEKCIGKPDDLLLVDDMQLENYYGHIKDIFVDKLEGKITKDLAKVIDYEEVLLEDLLKEGFKVCKNGLFFKKYNLEKYLIDQIGKLILLMDANNEDLTVKEFKSFSETLSTALKVVLKMIDKLLLHYEEYKEETNQSFADIKHLKKLE